MKKFGMKKAKNQRSRSNQRPPRDQRPHLLYLNQTLGMGGAESFMSDLLVQLQQIGWHIRVTAVHDQFINLLRANRIKTDKIPVVIDIVGDYKGLIKGLILWPLAVVIYLKKFFDYRNTDVVLTSGFAEKIFGTLASIIFHKPIVWIEFASVAPLISKFGGLPGVLYKLFLPYPKFIITSSVYSANILKTELPEVSEKIVVIPCGLKNLAIKKAHKTDSGRPAIICVSRLEKGKGQDYLIKAIKKVQQKNIDIKLKIVGIGETLYSLKKLANELKLQKIISFEGYVKDAKAEILNSDICVFPTLWELEGFGMVAVESMSLGVPVIAFDFGPVAEIITHEQDGLLAKAGDIDDLAANIIRLLKDHQLQNKLKKNALKTFQKRFTIEKSAGRYQKYLLAAMPERKSGI